MKILSDNLKFEEANILKTKINSLKNYQAKSIVVNTKIKHADVFSIFSDESYGYINYLEISHGAIVRSHTLEIKKRLEW